MGVGGNDGFGGNDGEQPVFFFAPFLFANDGVGGNDDEQPVFFFAPFFFANATWSLCINGVAYANPKIINAAIVTMAIVFCFC